MEENKKTADVEEKKGQELDLDDLDKVSGGANPFANISRVQDHKIDDSIRNKV